MIAIHQFCAGFALGDAISNEAILFQARLRKLGFKSNIYCDHFFDRDGDKVQPAKKFKPTKDSVLIYHHSMDSSMLATIRDLPCRKILVYHNVTPAEFVRPYNRGLADRLQKARDGLASLSNCFELSMADSHYNASDLIGMGFRDVHVLPVAMNPLWKSTPATERKKKGPVILFVGRVFPNKRHQDLLKAFYFFKKLMPDAELAMVGSHHPSVRGYSAELSNLVRELQLRDVNFTGMVSESTLIEAYRNSDLFLSMSEHEGFFVPAIESMHFGLPVLAFESSAIPETLGSSGVTFPEKNFPAVAEIMLELITNASLRGAVLKSQENRRQAFALDTTLALFDSHIKKLPI